MLALKFWRCWCALLIAALLLAIPASAQDPADPNEDTGSAETDEPTDPADLEGDLEEPDSEDLDETLRTDMRQQTSGIEEILITGEKQNTLQDAPTSSTSFNAGELQALRIEDIADLADYTPNLEINTAFAASNPTIFIRGIGLKDYNANAAGAVAVYQDGININAPAIQLGQLFDIDGIDVLRGPQGSVNGRNATAGAIMIRSAMPDGEFSVSTSLTYGNYNDREVEAAINIPLIEDMLSMRVSGTAQWRDGYTKNQCAGWDPEKLGFRRVDEDSTRKIHFDLDPRGGYTLNPDTGELEFGPVAISLRNGANPRTEFIYTNLAYAQELARKAKPGGEPIVGGVNVNGTGGNPWRLTKDLLDADGNVQLLPNGLPAVAGTSVAWQAQSISVNDVDDICTTTSPGKMVTTAGQAQLYETNDRNPRWLEGAWQPTRTQASLETFAGLKRWTNNVDNWAARIVLLFEPLDNMEWMVNAHGTQNRGDSAHLQMLGADTKINELGFFQSQESGFSENSAEAQSGFRLGEGIRKVPGLITDSGAVGEGGGNPYSGFYDSDGLELIDAWGINGRGFWDLGPVVITLLYDYEWYNRVVEDEGDATPRVVFPATWFDSAWQTSEELRAEGEGERYKWTTGFFFLHEELDALNYFPATQEWEIKQFFDQTLTSWAPYASGEIELVEEGVIPGIYQLTLGAGLRYNHEHKGFSLSSSAIPTAAGVEAVTLPLEFVEATWKEWTGDLQLSYTPFSNEYGTLLAYLKYGHGFKGGHFNAGLTITGGDDGADQLIDPVAPEVIDAVEFGIRSRWLDDRVVLNAAVFRYWYQELQVFDITNEAGELPIQKLLNADANVLGAEAELRVKPIPGLLISANMGWLDSEFGDFLVTKTVGRNRGVPTEEDFDYEGNDLVSAPEWNFSVITEYEIPLFGWGSLIPQYDFNYRSKAYLDPQMLDPISQDGYWLNNARITYRTPDDRIELAFWVSNLLEEEYKIDVFDVSRQSNVILEVWGEPRTYGVTLSLNW